MTIQISILGLRQVGTSIGLAVKASATEITCVGYDNDPAVAQKAEKLGAVSKVFYNLPACVQGSSVVILACPTDQIEPVVEAIAGDLKEGAVIINASPVKTAISAWLKTVVPQGRFLTGWNMALNPKYINEIDRGVDSAHDDLFEKSLIAISAPQGTPGKAIKLVTDLAVLIKGMPFYVDELEADGLSAMSHDLPHLMTLALIQTCSKSPGWREGRKLAGNAYARATLPVHDLDAAALVLNAENNTRLINDLINTLIDLRDLLPDGDPAALQKQIDAAQRQHVNWLAEREKASWESDEAPKQEMPTFSQSLGQMFLGSKLGGRKKKNP